MQHTIDALWSYKAMDLHTLNNEVCLSRDLWHFCHHPFPFFYIAAGFTDDSVFQRTTCKTIN